MTIHTFVPQQISGFHIGKLYIDEFSEAIIHEIMLSIFFPHFLVGHIQNKQYSFLLNMYWQWHSDINSDMNCFIQYVNCGNFLSGDNNQTGEEK